jgi:tripartite-type tricarboxylate transporter receptor subunit TctC
MPISGSRVRRLCAAMLGVTLLAAQPARADAVADFYQGRTVNLIIGYSVGGGYDDYARVLARHLGRHIPGNPNVVPQNMEGAGSLRAANYLAARAPKDGTAIATFARGAAFYRLMGLAGATFDATTLNWIGSANNETSLCVSWAASGITSMDDLRTREMTAGGTGPSDDTVQFVKVISAVVGAKIRPVSGYPGGNDVLLAMERGEVQGRCGWSYSSLLATRPTWLSDHKINILLQLGLRKHPDLPNVPLVMDLLLPAKSRAILRLVFARQVMGRPFAAPQGVPPERVAALRQAFMETMQDKEFLADAARANLEINPVSGQELQALMADLAKTPQEVALETGKMLQDGN